MIDIPKSEIPKIQSLFKPRKDRGVEGQGRPLNSDFREDLPNQDNLPNKDFHEDRFVRAKYVRNRFSISDPTLHRWVKAGKLPKPKYLNSQRVWHLSAIKEAEQKMLASEERAENRFI